MRISIAFLGLLAAASAACSDGPDGDIGSSGLTAGEVEQLERAAERIDNRPASPAKAEADALEADIRQRLDNERRTAETR